ncbi:hypothetical protein, partial [Enterobacter sp. UNJFSC 003]|uniref:hypothetical protein n=1 Tax=Enterobacter sp. UNJFSC 003 TaxID=3122077 RepID=UPI002EA49196|nr:hypothetical protein [Serratia liquefaciens]
MYAESDGVMAAWFDRHGIVAALVRPDHYVFGTARDPAELGDLLQEIDLRLRGGRAAPNHISDLTMERTS